MTIKTLLENLEAAEAKSDMIDEAWENDYSNEELEKAWNEAYKAENEAFNKVVSEIVTMTAGMIDEKTAGLMLRAKRAELKALVLKIA